MMDTEKGNRSRFGHIINWGTVWGLIFATIGFNVFANIQQVRSSKQVYQAQLQQRVKEIDSLRTVKYELDNQLSRVRTALDQCQTGQSPNMTNDRHTVASND